MTKPIKKVVAFALGLLSWFMPSLAQQNRVPKASGPEPVPANQPERARFAKEELVSALQKLNLDAKQIRVVSAECYVSVRMAGNIDFHCSNCGRKTSYQRQSDKGIQVVNFEAIRRSFADLPYKVSIDASGLCPVCGKDKQKTMIVHMACFECGKDFSWNLDSTESIQMLQWLYLRPPFTELDGIILSINGDGEAKAAQIRAGIAYIRDHVFCPLHRNVLNNVQK
jgi:hypothetical protein